MSRHQYCTWAGTSAKVLGRRLKLNESEIKIKTWCVVSCCEKEWHHLRHTRGSGVVDVYVDSYSKLSRCGRLLIILSVHNITMEGYKAEISLNRRTSAGEE